MGMFSGPKQRTDPALAQERARAEQERTSAIRDTVTKDTDMLLRLYGHRLAMSGGTLGSPPILGR